MLRHAVSAVAVAASFGPLPPANPFAGPVGTATMHGDTASSDSTPYRGPSGSPSARFQELGAACPTTLVGRDGMPLSLCTSIATRAPSVILLDPSTALPLATLQLTAGSLFAGVYPYLDSRDRVVVVDGSGDLLRIAHKQDALGVWHLSVDDRLPLRKGVVGLAPDWRGRVWFATGSGLAGYADPRTRAVRTIQLRGGVANSISTVPGGTAVVTDHALYELSAAGGKDPRARWIYSYDRGPARKPGQLSWGSGATPTYFGPRGGTEYVAITDNAAPHERLVALRRHVRKGQRRIVCRIPVLTGGVSGTENSPIGSGRSVFVASTYGYPYPAQPADQPRAQPASAPFTGGLTRVDIRKGGRGCRTRWTTAVRSAAVPRLSLGDGLVYTTERSSPSDPTATTPGDRYSLLAIDAQTGAIRSRTPLLSGEQADTLQMAPTITAGGVVYQGTISGIFRIAPG